MLTHFGGTVVDASYFIKFTNDSLPSSHKKPQIYHREWMEYRDKLIITLFLIICVRVSESVSIGQEDRFMIRKILKELFMSLLGSFAIGLMISDSNAVGNELSPDV